MHFPIFRIPRRARVLCGLATLAFLTACLGPFSDEPSSLPRALQRNQEARSLWSAQGMTRYAYVMTYSKGFNGRSYSGRCAVPDSDTCIVNTVSEDTLRFEAGIDSLFARIDKRLRDADKEGAKLKRRKDLFRESGDTLNFLIISNGPSPECGGSACGIEVIYDSVLGYPRWFREYPGMDFFTVDSVKAL